MDHSTRTSSGRDEAATETWQNHLPNNKTFSLSLFLFFFYRQEKDQVLAGGGCGLVSGHEGS